MRHIVTRVRSLLQHQPVAASRIGLALAFGAGLALGLLL